MHPTRAAGISEQRLVVVQANTLLGLIDLWQYLGFSAEEILRRSHERLKTGNREASRHRAQRFDDNSNPLLRGRFIAARSWTFEMRFWLCDRELETMSDPQRVANGVELLNRLVPDWPFLVRRELFLRGVLVKEQVFRYKQSANSAETLDRIVKFLGAEPGPLGYTHWWHEAHGFDADTQIPKRSTIAGSALWEGCGGRPRAGNASASRWSEDSPP